jgi:hypothetical protein
VVEEVVCPKAAVEKAQAVIDKRRTFLARDANKEI